MSGEHKPDQLTRFERALSRDAELVGRILRELPAVEVERERVIKTSRENADLAIVRAIAKAAVLGEFWRIEIES